MVSKKATRKSAKRPKAAKPLQKASAEEVPTARVKKGVAKAKARKNAKKEEEEPKEDAETPTDSEEDENDKKNNKTKANRLKEMQEEDEKEEKIDRGIVFIGHCPDGLYEPQLKRYLGQFGTVTNVRLARSQKTGNTKGHAWVEFEDIEVAKIVAQSLHGYLLEGRLLVCKVMTTDQVHRRFWSFSHRPQFIHDGPRKRRADAQLKNDRPTLEVDGYILPQQTLNQIMRQDNNIEKLQAKLEDLGIDYDLSPFIVGKGHPVVEAALREREEALKAEEVKSKRTVKAAAEVVQKHKAKNAAAADSAATAEAEADRGEAAEGEAAKEKAAPVRKRKKAGEPRDSAASAEVEEKADANNKEPAAPAAQEEAGEAQKPRPKKKKKQSTA